MPASRQPKRAALALRLLGSEIHPEDLPTYGLVNLVVAAAELLSAVADELGHAPQEFAVTELREGTVRCCLTATKSAHETAAINVVKRTHVVVKNGGADASEAVCQRLQRLHAAGAPWGGVTARAMGPGIRRHAVTVTAPTTAPPAQKIAVSTTKTLYGTVVGVNSQDSGRVVTIERDSGGRARLFADATLAARAANMFEKTVRAKMELTLDDDDQWQETRLISLSTWEDAPLLETVDKASARLRASGRVIALSEFRKRMRELD